jgi:dihydrofolate reductase
MSNSASVPFRRIEGYAVVSEDGMIADAAGRTPDLLKFEADRRFFERGIDDVDLVVHGRHSREEQLGSGYRRRLILTREIPAVAADPSNENAVFWNPAGASFEQALAALGTPDSRIGILGGTDVFGLFLDSYDVFHLSRVPDVRLPGGRPLFPEVPIQTPEEVLARHGLRPGPRQVLDPAHGVAVVSWRRSSKGSVANFHGVCVPPGRLG